MLFELFSERYEQGATLIMSNLSRRAERDGPGQPRQHTFLAPFRIATRPVKNRDWIPFIEAGGYGAPTLWLSDGWARAEADGWDAPLY